MEKTVTKLLLEFDGSYNSLVEEVEKVVEEGVSAWRKLEDRMKGELLKVKDKQLADAEKLI